MRPSHPQGEYPDLTASGGPIEVGFLRANSTGAGHPTGFTNPALIDNWTVRLNPPCANRVAPSGTTEESIAARSRHPTGVNAVMCDGAVKFFTNNIALDVWRGLGSSFGGETISVD